VLPLRRVLPPEERAPTMLLLLWVTRGSLAAAGTWRADVLVRTVTVDQYRTLPRLPSRLDPAKRAPAPAPERLAHVS
jgi:hypothetical protein